MTEFERLRVELKDLQDEERRIGGVIVKLQEHSATLTEKIFKLKIKIREKENENDNVESD